MTPANGKALWHLRLNSMVSNGPSTFLLEGKQYIVVGSGDTLWHLNWPENKEAAVITRRHMLAAAGSASALWTLDRLSAQSAPPPLKNMGGAPAGFGAHSSGGRGGLGAPARGATPGGGRGPAGGGRAAFDFLGYFHGLGFGVAEGARPASNEPADIAAFRARVEQYNMRVILDVGFPRDENGLEAFDANVKMAKEAGAIGLHAAMTQRRYEEFSDFATFKASFERNQKSIAMAEPILRKYRMRLGLENHKGWRSAEQAAWLKRIGSEWVGAHFDFGNNISLCEDPNETLKNLLRTPSLATLKIWRSTGTTTASCFRKSRSARVSSISKAWWRPCKRRTQHGLRS
ncbi:MAG: TIM barrel protein [Ignavibacteriota bacterium]